jgi:hypothetical protein
MATAAIAPQATSERSDNDRRMFGLLREMRAACQYLQSGISDTLANTPADADAAKRDETLAVAVAPLLERTDAFVAPCLLKIRQVFDAAPDQYEWAADAVTTIALRWSEGKAAASEPGVGAAKRLDHVLDALDRIIYQCESLSLSPSVNDVLRNLIVGQALDIEFEFGDEFPKDAALRKRLIQELAQESGALDSGIVDTEKGVIYKVAATRSQQVRSIWRLLGWLALGFVISPGLAYGGQLLKSGWPVGPGDLVRLLVDYVLILVGSGAHFAISALKNAKSDSKPNFQPIDDWVLWLHVHEAAVRKGILSIWLGYTLLAFGLPKLDWSSAFFAGYSIDSITDLFLSRFEDLATTKTAALTKEVKNLAGSPAA